MATRANTRGIASLSLGIATMWLPIHYSSYRYSIVGDEGPYYALALATMLVCCIAGMAARSRLSAWPTSAPARR